MKKRKTSTRNLRQVKAKATDPGAPPGLTMEEWREIKMELARRGETGARFQAYIRARDPEQLRELIEEMDRTHPVAKGEKRIYAHFGMEVFVCHTPLRNRTIWHPSFLGLHFSN